MGRFPWLVVALTAGLAGPGAAAAAPADAGAEGGRSLFKTYCASCHGVTAKGDGPLADQLRFHPPDLTLLAKRSNGKFDSAKVEKIIDGRDQVKGHGGPDMPVWGDAFKGASEGYSEKAVKERIKAIVDYLETIQVK